MASEPPVAVYDACVLYPFHLRNVLVQCAFDGLVEARWTDDIHAEWMRNLAANSPGTSLERLEPTRDLMKAVLPDADVAGYQDLIPSLSPARSRRSARSRRRDRRQGFAHRHLEPQAFPHGRSPVARRGGDLAGRLPRRSPFDLPERADRQRQTRPAEPPQDAAVSRRVHKCAVKAQGLTAFPGSFAGKLGNWALHSGGSLARTDSPGKGHALPARAKKPAQPSPAVQRLGPSGFDRCRRDRDSSPATSREERDDRRRLSSELCPQQTQLPESGTPPGARDGTDSRGRGWRAPVAEVPRWLNRSLPAGSRRRLHAHHRRTSSLQSSRAQASGRCPGITRAAASPARARRLR